MMSLWGRGKPALVPSPGPAPSLPLPSSPGPHSGPHSLPLRLFSSSHSAAPAARYYLFPHPRLLPLALIYVPLQAGTVRSHRYELPPPLGCCSSHTAPFLGTASASRMPLHPGTASSRTLPVSWAPASPLTRPLIHCPSTLCPPHPLLHPSPDPDREHRSPGGETSAATRVSPWAQPGKNDLCTPTPAFQEPPRQHLDISPLGRHPFTFPPCLHPCTPGRPGCSRCDFLEEEPWRRGGGKRLRDTEGLSSEHHRLTPAFWA